MDGLDLALQLGLNPVPSTLDRGLRAGLDGALAQRQQAPRPTPGPGTSPGGGEADLDEDLQKTTALGRQLFGDDPVGALQQSRTAGAGARQQKIQALRAARERLEAKSADLAIPALQAAAAFFAPTKTGAFTENLSGALSAATPGIRDQMLLKNRREEKIDELGVAEADVGVQDADRAYQELLQRMQLGSSLTDRALRQREIREGRQDRLEDRRLTREQTAELRRQTLAIQRERLASGERKAALKMVPGVGLVRVGADGTPELIYEASDPKLDARIAELFKSSPAFKDRAWESPEQQAEALRRAVQAFKRGEMDPSNMAPPSATPQAAPMSAPGGTAPITATPAAARRVSEEFDLDGTAPQVGPNTQNIPSGAMPPMNSKVVPKGQEAEKAFEGKDLAKWGADVADEAQAAITLNDQIDVLRRLDAKTGRLAPARRFFGSWADAFGMSGFKESINSANNLTAFNGVVKDLVLNKQLLQKGVQTEGDRKVMLETLANESNPEAANDLMLRYAKALNWSADQRQRFVGDWRKSMTKNGTLMGDDGKSNARDAWLGYRAKIPLVGKDQEGKLIYLNEYLEAARQANQDAPGWQKNAMRSWNARFGGGR